MRKQAYASRWARARVETSTQRPQPQNVLAIAERRIRMQLSPLKSAVETPPRRRRRRRSPRTRPGAQAPLAQEAQGAGLAARARGCAGRAAARDASGTWTRVGTRGCARGTARRRV
eukprot:Amastigsp_a846400_8.p3 type:complete len:116 gc:universal Amastigsp_a846400_8:561-214(-)